MDTREEIKKLHKQKGCKEQFPLFYEPSILIDLIEIIENKEPYPLEELASWILTHCSRNTPLLLSPHALQLILILQKTTNHSVRRNILSTLAHLKLSKDDQMLLEPFCQFIIEDKTQKVAVHYYAKKIIQNIYNN